LDIKADKKERGSDGRISHEAINAYKKWEKVRRQNLHLGIKVDKNWKGGLRPTTKKLRTFLPISLSLQEKVPK
jgi:hypothetical protein